MARQTIASVSFDLKEHLARCEEQNKTIFKSLNELKADIDLLNKRIEKMLYAVVGFLTTTVVAVLISVLTI